MHTYFDHTIQDTVYSAGFPAWEVKAVQPHRDFTLLLTFADGSVRLYDARPLLQKNLYAALRDPDAFMQAAVSGDTVSWGNEIDIAPEHLYANSQTVTA